MYSYLYMYIFSYIYMYTPSVLFCIFKKNNHLQNIISSSMIAFYPRYDAPWFNNCCLFDNFPIVNIINNAAMELWV